MFKFSKLILFSNLYLAYCNSFEIIGDPEYVSDIETDPFVFPEYLIPFSGGSNFTNLPVDITVLIVDGNEIQIRQVDFVNKKSNIDLMDISLLDKNNNIVDEKFSVSASQPILFDVDSKISKIKIKLIKTKDNFNPTFVELSIKACKSLTLTSQTTTFMPTTTTQPLVTVTTTETLPTTTSIFISSKLNSLI